MPHVVAAAQTAGYKVQVLTLTPRADLGDVKQVGADLAKPLAIIWALKVFRTSHIAMAGGIVLSDRTREGLARFAGGGEATISRGDTAISGLGRVLKTMTGADLIPVQQLAPDLLAPAGLIAGPPVDMAGDAIEFALATARAIGGLDVGQGAVTTGGRVISVEDIGGTDRLLARVARYRQEGLTGDGADPLILAKAVKPDQPLFVDLPAVGPETIENAAAAGISIIVLEAGAALLIERDRLVEAANAAGITVLGRPGKDG